MRYCAWFDLYWEEIVETPLQFPLQVSEHCREDGAAAPTRTGDLLITNQLLYQLSYASLRPAHEG